MIRSMNDVVERLRKGHIIQKVDGCIPFLIPSYLDVPMDIFDFMLENGVIRDDTDPQYGWTGKRYILNILSQKESRGDVN